MEGFTIKFIECTPDTTDIVVVWSANMVDRYKERFPNRNVYHVDFNCIQDYMLDVEHSENDTVFVLTDDSFYFYKGRK